VAGRIAFLERASPQMRDLCRRVIERDHMTYILCNSKKAGTPGSDNEQLFDDVGIPMTLEASSYASKLRPDTVADRLAGCLNHRSAQETPGTAEKVPETREAFRMDSRYGGLRLRHADPPDREYARGSR
jgi:hypothetical protein